jgi:hypothetical protein
LVFSIKIRDSETGDTLRIPQKCQKCRYAKKTQISLDLKKYRYVGETWKFENAYLVQISSDICEPVVICETTIYGKSAKGYLF